MKPREVIVYLTGADYLAKHMAYQQQLLQENTGLVGPILPTQGDLRTAGRVYGDRLRMMGEYPALLFLRVSGLELATRAARQRLLK